MTAFKSCARRYRDAWLKSRQSGRQFTAEILAGCGPDAHPYSTWTKSSAPRWPLKHLNEVLKGMAMSTPPVPFVYNLQAALGGLQVASGGDWVMDLDEASGDGTAAGFSSATGRASNAIPMVERSAEMPTPGIISSPGAFTALASSFNATSMTPPTPVWRPAATAPTVLAHVAPAPGAAREVKASEWRIRARGGRDRGIGRTRVGRGAPGGERGKFGAGSGAGTGAGSHVGIPRTFGEEDFLFKLLW